MLQSAAPPTTDPAVLQADIEAMGIRIGQLSERNFKLEAQVAALLEEIGSLTEQLDAKSRLIRQQANLIQAHARTATPHRTPEPKPQPTSAVRLRVTFIFKVCDFFLHGMLPSSWMVSLPSLEEARRSLI